MRELPQIREVRCMCRVFDSSIGNTPHFERTVLGGLEENKNRARGLWNGISTSLASCWCIAFRDRTFAVGDKLAVFPLALQKYFVIIIFNFRIDFHTYVDADTLLTLECSARGAYSFTFRESPLTYGSELVFIENCATTATATTQ